ncbi:MAG: hypothetical protein AAGA09_09640 [Pseudomonadota bacterium]
MGVREELTDELKALRGDRRKLALIIILGAVAMLQVMLSAGDWASARWAGLAELKNERRQSEALVKAAQNADLAARARQGAARAKSWSFTGQTFAIARLNAQQKVASIANEAGLNGVSITPSADIDGEGDIRFFTMTLEGTFTWPTFLDFLDGLSGLNEGVDINYFAVSPGRVQQFRLIVRAPLTVGTTTNSTPPVAPDDDGNEASDVASPTEEGSG